MGFCFGIVFAYLRADFQFTKLLEVTMLIKFKDIPVGSWFYDKYNENHWIKRSSRTAELVFNNRVFYFSQNEVYHILTKEV